MPNSALSYEQKTYVRTALYCKVRGVLLQLRSDCPVWHLPGGKVEEVDKLDLKKSIQRETQEETLLEIPADNFEEKAIFTRDYPEHKLNIITHMFLANLTTDAKPYLNEPDEFIAQRFFKLSELPTNLPDNPKQMILYCFQENIVQNAKPINHNRLVCLQDYCMQTDKKDIPDLDFWRSHPTVSALKVQNKLPIFTQKFFD